MRYLEPLPPVRQLLSLSKKISFPANRKSIVQTARAWGFPAVMNNFLKLFPSNEIFESRTDFITRCEELELLLRQELSMPPETLRSPQG